MKLAPLLVCVCSCAALPVRPDADVLRDALPAVVLVVTQRPDGKIGYGSGLVVGQPRRVLTNAHVITDATQLRVMTWDPKRTTYIPQEGGLARFLFENEAALLPARLVRADPELDLAVLDSDGLEALPLLPWRTAPVAPGERVLALGHPAETVWSFTAGVVSSLHAGMVQTDAAINVGNSGGPLIDAQGRVVGLNTSRLIGAVQGIGFARPISMAQGLLDGVSAPVTMDRTSPARAHVSCSTAAELASDAYLGCIDVDGFLRFLQLAQAGILDGVGLSAEQRAEVQRRLPPVTLEVARDVLAENYHAMFSTLRPLVESAGTDDEQARRQRYAEVLRAKNESYVRDLDASVLARTGMKLDRKNPRATQEILRMGHRVERVATVEGTAWVEVAGRNSDGTPYRVSELWVSTPGGWVERQALLAGDEATLPAGFALPALSAEEILQLAVKPQLEAVRQTLGAGP